MSAECRQFTTIVGVADINLLQVLSAPLAANNPVIAGIFDAAGNRMPSADSSARRLYANVEQATRTNLKAMVEREDLITYGSLFSPGGAGSQVVAGTANQKIKVFDISYEATVTGLHYMYFGANNGGATVRFASRATVGVFAQTFPHPHIGAAGDSLWIWSTNAEANMPVTVHYVKEA